MNMRRKTANPDNLSKRDIWSIKAGIADIRAGRVVTRKQLEKLLGIRR
jgi:predicted transcriptional regulator